MECFSNYLTFLIFHWNYPCMFTENINDKQKRYFLLYLVINCKSVGSALQMLFIKDEYTLRFGIF